MALLRRQRLLDGMRHVAADHLGDAALARLAGDDALGAGLALAVGAAAVALRALRKRAVDVFTGLLERLGAHLDVQMDVPGRSRAAEGQGSTQGEQGDQISQGIPQKIERVSPRDAL